ncbi:MAG: hypothetical protein M3515_04425 [Actinomycetota bacterium]|nr:hypothetical protein [Actinomycetota bacterium]
MQGRIFLAAAMALASAVFVAPAAAHQASSVDARIDQALAGARPGQFVQVKPFGPTRRASDGLLEIRLAGGQVVKTHGLDPEPPVTAADAAAGGAHPERGLNCADLPRLQVLYVHPSDRPNRFSKSMYERIRTYMRRMSHRLNADALSSSQGRIGADYRVRCKSSGKIDIRALETRTTAARDDWSIIQADLKRAGHDSRQGKYLVWYDDPVERGCGLGNIEGDDTKSASNRHNVRPFYAVVWGNIGTRICWNWRVGMHENGHNMGAVQYAAPRSSGDKWHCNDGLDLMCYADGGDKSNYSVRRCDNAVFDCGKDTYFDTLTEPGEWLRGHWNIGWSGNRFLDFSRPDAPRPSAEAGSGR